MEHGFLHLCAVSAVVMCVSYTITKERIFSPLRKLLGGRETWCGYLFTCPYCTSHWVAFLLVPLTGAYYLKVPYDWGVLSKILTWFLSSILVVIIAAFFRILFFVVDETQGLVRRKQKQVETVTEIVKEEHEEPHHVQ